MNLKNDIYEIKIDDFAQVDSILYKGKEMLYQGNEGWKKKFPIIFPNLGTSTGYEYKGKKYNMPKHGWWKDLKWESFYEKGELLSVATIVDKELFPFKMDITQRITLEEESVVFSYELTNLDKEKAYFQFGIHPAFKIDENAHVRINETFKEVDSNGILTKETRKPHQSILKQMPFGTEFDTLIATDVKTKEIELFNNLEVLNIKFNSPHLQLWKPSRDSFVCIEPWYGWNDSFERVEDDITKKKQMITLIKGKTWTAKFELKVSSRK